MAKNFDQPEEKKPRKKKMLMRLLVPMLFLILFQLITFFSVLAFGGEFSSIKKYAYDTLVEKTRNRTEYIEKEFCQKPVFVYETAGKN